MTLFALRVVLVVSYAAMYALARRYMRREEYLSAVCEMLGLIALLLFGILTFLWGLA